MSISILAVVGCFVSIVAPYRLKPNYRFCMVWIIAIAGLIAGISQFIMIGLRGGCKARFYSQQVTRCSIQLGVSTVDLVWVAMLLAEGALNYQRSIDKDFQTRRREAEEDVQAQRQQMEDEIARRNAEVAEVGEEPDDYLGDVDGNYAVATDEGRNGDLGPDEIEAKNKKDGTGAN
ncbi:hypothetical protein FBU30_006952 [Linnemannia zychae]|nr:hypothetical protein FBU30_006952 [Linnemannia zychae]